jgi:hypothetical protein
VQPLLLVAATAVTSTPTATVMCPTTYWPARACHTHTHTYNHRHFTQKSLSDICMKSPIGRGRSLLPIGTRGPQAGALWPYHRASPGQLKPPVPETWWELASPSDGTGRPTAGDSVLPIRESTYPIHTT